MEIVFLNSSLNLSIVLINILLAFILIYFEHNEPNVTWAWLLVLLMLPILGFILYLIIGLDGKRQKVYIKKQQNDQQIWDDIFKLDYEGLEFLHMHENKVLLKEYLGLFDAKKFQRLVSLNYRTNNSTISMNNNVNVFFEGRELFDEILKDVNNAKEYVHLQSYIIRDDYVGRELRDALIEASNRGVEVKVLTDKIGSLLLNRLLIAKLKEQGVKTTFFPMFTKFSMNLRNHRKLAVIDGKIGYIGGYNIGKEYLGEGKKFNHWRDCHIKILGDSVKMLEISFIKDWNSSPREEHITYEEKYFPIIEKDETYNAKIQIVQSGPDTKDRNIELAFVKLINTAQRSLYIVTPYFTPGPSLVTAIKNAVLSGVNVTIMIPKNPDHAFVFGASISHIKELVDIGANCYAYEDGFVHSKILIVDDTVTSIGSANFDTRSFKLNFEITAFIYSNYLAKQVAKQIKDDINQSVRLTPDFYNKRSRVDKVKEAFSRLLSPLL